MFERTMFVDHVSLAARLLLIILLPMLGLSISNVHAQTADTFVVDNTLDAPDAAPDGICAADVPTPRRCTLRAAIMEANALGGPQTIQVPLGTYRLTIAGRVEDSSRTGDLDITSDITLVGGNNGSKARPIIDATGLIDRVLHVRGTASNNVRLQNMVIRGGDTRADEDTRSGAGIYIDTAGVTAIEGVVIEGNAAETAGGLMLFGKGTVNVRDSVIRNNVATFWGGGMYIFDKSVLLARTTIIGNQAADGAGIYTFKHSSPSMRVNITHSAIVGNAASQHGGGVYMRGESLVQLSSSTVSSNTAERGGGIHSEGTLTLESSTIAQNSNHGVFAIDSFSTVNSILANNSGSDCFLPNNANRITGTGNLSGGQSCRFKLPESNLSNVNPLIGPLAFNGGTTHNHKLLPGSPAINAGRAICDGTIDQRGVQRPQGTQCDIGAYEVPANELPPTTPTPTPRPKMSPTPIPPMPPQPTDPTE